VVFSATRDADVVDAISKSPNTTFVSKWGAPSLREFVDKIEQILGRGGDPKPPRPFIVHGHDSEEKLALKNYLQNTLGLPEPVILHELPSLGRTVIEKLEETEQTIDIVFVLLTPDDVIAGPKGTNDEKRRARQNVIFELGYFLGVFGRRSNRVFLLYKGDLDLPSDLGGIIYIDVSNGIVSAGETIRRELADVR
jgi:predicted nucleotide-binding protein